MTSEFSRRGLLKTLGAGASLIASPSFGQATWSIQGSGHGELRLVFYTDVHANGTEETSAALAMAAEAINAQKPDVVLCGGDLIADGFDSSSAEVAPQWDAYIGLARAIEAEHHAVVGNRDLVGVRPTDTSPAAPDPRLDFRQRLGVSRTFGSFEALGYRFILLDSLRTSDDTHMYEGWVSSEQMEWLQELLSTTHADIPIVLTLHMPLLTSFFNATRGGTFQAQPNRVVLNNVDVLKLFARHNLILVLQGHLHVTEALLWRGTTFLTGGAICARWWRGPYFGTIEGFNTITLREDRIEWEYVDYGWHAFRQER